MPLSLFSLGRGGLGFAGCVRPVSVRRAFRALVAVRSRCPLCFFRVTPAAVVVFGPSGRGDCLLVVSAPWAFRWERLYWHVTAAWHSAVFSVCDRVAPRWTARRWPL